MSIELPEFTCKCPFSGYPDFAVLRLIYQPGPRVVELKAIKLYVNSYRDQSISHEEVTNRILDDLVAATDPVWMQLEAEFQPPRQRAHRGAGESRHPSALLIDHPLLHQLRQFRGEGGEVAVAEATHAEGSIGCDGPQLPGGHEAQPTAHQKAP